MNRTTVSFAGSSVAIEHEGHAAARLMRLLFARVQTALTPTDNAVLLSLRSEPTEGSDQLVLSRADGVLLRSEDLGRMAECLQTEVSFHLMDGCTRGPVIHAGAVAAADGGGILLPAQSGSGKSTLTAWLVARGFAYLSDELGHLVEDSGRVYGFRRPIELKQGGYAVIEPLLAADKPEQSWLPTPPGYMLGPELLHEQPARESAELRAIVFPRYAKGQARELRQLSAAETSAKLLQCCLNARLLPAHGLPAAAAWARRVPGYALRYEELAGIDDVIASCVRG